MQHIDNQAVVFVSTKSWWDPWWPFEDYNSGFLWARRPVPTEDSICCRHRAEKVFIITDQFILHQYTLTSSLNLSDVVCFGISIFKLFFYCILLLMFRFIVFSLLLVALKESVVIKLKCESKCFVTVLSFIVWRKHQLNMMCCSSNKTLHPDTQ